MTLSYDYYRLRPDIDIVPLGEESFLFRSDIAAVKLEGKSSLFFVNSILPLLDGRHKLSSLHRKLPEISLDDLKIYLERLFASHVLERSDRPFTLEAVNDKRAAPLLYALDQLGIPKTEALEKLNQIKIAIFGLEGPGAYLASFLAKSGVGSITLVDPYLCDLSQAMLTPLTGLRTRKITRQDALKEFLQSQSSLTEIRTEIAQPITQEKVLEIASKCNFLVGCFDRGFSSTNYWINSASLALNIPAIYAEAKSYQANIGPLVIPGKTACYMCYRMRSIACEDDFFAAFNYEKFLDHQKKPRLHERGVFPSMPPYIGSVLALEILKCSLSLAQLSLTGNIQVFDAFTLQTESHAVLQESTCPACGEKKNLIRWHPTTLELIKANDPVGDLNKSASRLVSARTGVIRKFQRIQKDISEPFLPYVIRTEVSNHRYFERGENSHLVCSGKGMTYEDAQVSALGESIERYSGTCWDFNEVVYADRSEFEESLDPARLVLYLPHQYEQLPYARYSDSSRMGWVKAYSLVRETVVNIPAIAVFMNYEVHSPEEYICPITSNGLAAGSTLKDAVLKAAYEVFERDAFMVTWLNRLPCKQIDPMTHPQADIKDLCRAYQRRGVELRLFRLPTDHPCNVFLALGMQLQGDDGPAIVVGLGADLDPVRAARQSILEVAQVRPALLRRMRNPETIKLMQKLVADPRLVSSLEDHDLLYASRETSGAFDFLLNCPSGCVDWESQPGGGQPEKLLRLIDTFRTQGRDLIDYNLTSPDMHALGIYTARVIIPDFQPIDFGWKERRLGGKRLYDFPYRMGFTPAPVSPDRLNCDPHPLS